MDSTNFDVLIIGAGLSGINAAYRVQKGLPNYSYAVLEDRNQLGGTWSLFKYPGIRSDSDLFTFGFPWDPWNKDKAIATAPAILNYLQTVFARHGIDQHIKYCHKVISLDWSSKIQQWRVRVLIDGTEPREYFARFVVMGTGYYDYHEGLKAGIPGLPNFHDQVIHPQFWPEDLDYNNKKVVIIGSGATAVTILPAMHGKPRILPCYNEAQPTSGRQRLRGEVSKALPPGMSIYPHFAPSYLPWEQRMCVVPDGDFFKALRSGKASVVTDQIDTVTQSGIRLKSGQELDADIIVTATGLKMQFLGKASLQVDGQQINVGDKFLWRGAMLQDVPNLALLLGYTNAFWTLGSDVSSCLFVRMVKDVRRRGMTTFIPTLMPGESDLLQETPMMNLKSSYVKNAMERNVIPKCGNSAAWWPRRSYFLDLWFAKYGDISAGIVFSRG